MWTEAVNTAEKQIPMEELPILPKRNRLSQILPQRIPQRRTHPQNLNRNRIPSLRKAGTPAMVEQNNTILSKK